MILPVIPTSSTISQLLVSVLKGESNTGLLEIHGDLTGVNKVSSESLEEPTILLLKLIALGVHQKIPGLMMKDITPLRLRRIIHGTMKSNQSSNQRLKKLKQRPVESKKHSSRMVQDQRPYKHGMKLMRMNCQKPGIGVMLMV